MPFSFALCLLCAAARALFRLHRRILERNGMVREAALGQIPFEYLAWIAQWACWALDWGVRLALILAHLLGLNRPVRIRVAVRVLTNQAGEPAVPERIVERWLREAGDILGPYQISLSAAAISLVPGEPYLASTRCEPASVFRRFFTWFSSHTTGWTPRITIYVVRSIIGASGCSFPGTGWVLIGANASGSVLVHEIGHLCDLWGHSTDPDNVMTVRRGGTGSRLTNDQALMIRTSRFARVEWAGSGRSNGLSP